MKFAVRDYVVLEIGGTSLDTINILLLDTQKRLFEGFQEAFQDILIAVYVVGSQKEVHRILANQPIEIVVFAL